MYDKETADAYQKALYGKNSIRANAGIVIQLQGEQEGAVICAIIGSVRSDIRSLAAQKAAHVHEFVIGDIIFVPRYRFSDGRHLGLGLTGLATEALYPQDWEFIENEHGVLIPNPVYDPMSH